MQGSILSSPRPGVSLVPYQLMARSRASIVVGRGGRHCPPAVRFSVEEATQRCELAMGEVARTQVQAHASKTVARRHQHAAEAQGFFDLLPPEWGITLDTAGPEHVLWYAQGHWLPNHPGSCHGACCSCWLVVCWLLHAYQCGSCRVHIAA
jgi:hypothetical protein